MPLTLHHHRRFCLWPSIFTRTLQFMILWCFEPSSFRLYEKVIMKIIGTQKKDTSAGNSNFNILFPFNVEIANAREPIGGIAATAFFSSRIYCSSRFLIISSAILSRLLSLSITLSCSIAIFFKERRMLDKAFILCHSFLHHASYKA